MTDKGVFGIQTVHDFFRDVVEPDYEDCLEDRRSPRKAIHSVLSMDAIRDWVNQSKVHSQSAEPATLSWNAVYEKCPEMKSVHSLAIGAKHFVADDPAKAIMSTTTRGFSSAYSDAFDKGGPKVEHGGRPVRVDSVLEGALRFWIDYLDRIDADGHS